MIAWQNPEAFAMLAVLAGPVAIHLLQRQRARRVAFPTDRFIRPSVTGAVRLRLPADLVLLLLRLAVAGAAVCAVAQPVLVTRGRIRTWDSRIARAVVVDVSGSMAAAAAAAAEEAKLEIRSATTAVRVDSTDLGDGIRRAAAALETAPPARREIVVVSDFQRGALTGPAIHAVPERVGLRLVRVGSAAARRQVTGPTLLAAAEGRAQRMEIAVDADRTRVALVPAAPTGDGLQVSGASDEDRIRLLNAVASSGTPAQSAEQPIVVAFGKGGSAAPSHLETRWMLETVLRLRRDRELSEAAEGPMIRASGSGHALLLNVDAAPDSYISAATVRGVLAARYGDVVDRFAEHEVGSIPDGQLSAWSREADALVPDAWRHARENDAPWFWGIALVLLGIETFVRARGPR